MPLGKGVRYRVKATDGKKVRLAFRGKKVVEAKNLGTGATHTPAEFARDEKMRKSTKGSPSFTGAELAMGYRRVG